MATTPLELITRHPLVEGARAMFKGRRRARGESRGAGPLALARRWRELPRPSPEGVTRAPRDLVDYTVDAMQRNVLYADLLRQRGNQYFEHLEQGQPPVLQYDYEVILDGRDLERPVNYYLVRILPDDVEIDGAKRPYVIIDPRAGHGPGIGGFKSDSQVGVAMRRGHAVYFVAFRERPEPGQTLADVAEAEAAFLERVDWLHPDAPHPCVIGNCQAGWAVAMLAAVRPEVVGPIVLNGAPMSYWAGAHGKNPMRYLGGLWGGTWIASMLADLGDGLFDGAYLVQNFENLNPSNTLFTKQYNVWANVDTEGPRYLGFERWWNGFFLMNDEEMEFIVDNLFIGNKLGAGQVMLRDGHPVSLRDIKAPIVIFASDGDNITPPQQALNWIADVYPSDQAILEDQQVIIYTLHEDVGHLGIFVSGRVARREHTSIIGTMEFIEDLPPGLYEMIISPAEEVAADDPFAFDYDVRFVERSIDDILRLDDSREDEDAFASLAAVSEINAAFYRAMVRPWVQLWANEASAEWMRRALPIRAQHEIFSDRNPWMYPVKWAAARVRARRAAVDGGNTFKRLERTAAQAVIDGLDAWRDLRDDSSRAMFEVLYGATGMGAIFPGRQERAERPPLPAEEQERLERELARLRGAVDEGGFVEGFARVLVWLSRSDRDVEPRAFVLLAELVGASERLAGVSYEQLLAIAREQFMILRLEPQAARAALPSLLATPEERADALEMARFVILHGDRPNRAERAVLDEIEALLELGEEPPREES